MENRCRCRCSSPVLVTGGRADRGRGHRRYHPGNAPVGSGEVAGSRLSGVPQTAGGGPLGSVASLRVELAGDLPATAGSTDSSRSLRTMASPIRPNSEVADRETTTKSRVVLQHEECREQSRWRPDVLAGPGSSAATGAPCRLWSLDRLRAPLAKRLPPRIQRKEVKDLVSVVGAGDSGDNRRNLRTDTTFWPGWAVDRLSPHPQSSLARGRRDLCLSTHRFSSTTGAVPDIPGHRPIVRMVIHIPDGLSTVCGELSTSVRSTCAGEAPRLPAGSSATREGLPDPGMGR